MEKHRVRGDARILKNLLTFLNSEIGVQIANIRVPISIALQAISLPINYFGTISL